MTSTSTTAHSECAGHAARREGARLWHTPDEALDPDGPAPQHCITALRVRGREQRAEREAADKEWRPLSHQPEGLVFTTVTGRPMEPRGLNRMLTVLCRQAGVRRVRVHDLRHTCASLLLAQSVDARTIMETLGHSTITLTLNTYAHVMDTTLRAAAERMDDALGTDEGEEGDDGAAGVPAAI